MNRHEGVSCDSCLKNNFRGRRYKCLICIDYDLCAACYESGATTNQHTTEHPMQCILSRSDFDLYYGGESLALEQPQAYTCPFCNRMGFTDAALMEHVTAEHADTSLAVVCPVCASLPGGEPNFVTDDFAGHLTLEHRTGPRDLISFLDEPSGIRHGGMRRMPPTGRGVGRTRRTNMHFSTSGGIASLSPSSRDAVVDPIAELLSQLSGVRRGAQPDAQLDLAPRHTTTASSLASTADNSLVLGNKSVSSRPQSMSLVSQCGEEQIAGEYNKHYVTLKQIGKGAYGCVKMAYRRSDRLLAVAKFILKEKVGAAFWTEAPDGRRLPLELSLLMTLEHPNIVRVIDVFENDKYFQMVMEKHGAGMDLFEFIERRPRLDEPLLSYIFRQIGQAVEYLHSHNILHRDIKDENVIIDNKFHVKLIDFGSATYMSKDTLFSTFYGTTEYCSPEVLAGNKYAGPELEMWSMGITLYVLTFLVNPFSDIEDIIQGPLTLPQIVSEDLEQLIRWMLCKDPVNRCSVAQLMAHPWIRQPVAINNYVFQDIVDCDRHEANPEMYFSGSLGSPRSGSQVSLADPHAKERSNPSEVVVRSGDKNVSRDEPKRSSVALHALSGERDAHSDNYSLRSSADILDISSKPVSEAALTDISSDATGHAACDIDYDCDPYECDSWDECEQDSFS